MNHLSSPQTAIKTIILLHYNLKIYCFDTYILIYLVCSISTCLCGCVHMCMYMLVWVCTCVHLNACGYVYTCTSTCLCGHVHMCTLVGAQGWPSRWFLVALLMLRHSPVNLELSLIQLVWLASELQGHSCLCYPSLEVIDVPALPGFYMTAGVLNSGFHDYIVAGDLLTKPSPQSRN